MPYKLARSALRMAVVMIAAAVLPVFMVGSSTAIAANPVVVIDVDSGKVLFSDRATDPWYPASITKLMTTYVALQAIQGGRIKSDTLLTVSAASASLPPSKIGFKPGTQVRLDNALKIIMVKSANDIANTIAEGVGGSTENFIAMMNRTAQQLGMVNTRFVNPHGLPDERQQTSARDMALLGRALILQFPEHNSLFHIGAIQLGRRVMHNTNGLIGRYPGADGMKTGFICASGFNVVATATRGNKQLLAVILGAPSANERTLMAASLFDKGFSSGTMFSPSLESLPSSNTVTPPNLRSLICDRKGPLSEDEDGAVTTNGNSDAHLATFFGSSALAFSDSSAGSAHVALPPRAKTQPELVWAGLTPPASREQAVAADTPKTKPLKGKTNTAVVKTKVALPQSAISPETKLKPGARMTTSVKPVSVDRKAVGTKTSASAPAKPASKAKPVKLVAPAPVISAE